MDRTLETGNLFLKYELQFLEVKNGRIIRMAVKSSRGIDPES